MMFSFPKLNFHSSPVQSKALNVSSCTWVQLLPKESSPTDECKGLIGNFCSLGVGVKTQKNSLHCIISLVVLDLHEFKKD
jgi:hypothetical protein